MSSATVVLTRCETYDRPEVAEAIRRQFELFGGVGRFVKRGDRVLLKPNFIAPEPPDKYPTQTHPAVIVETARLLKDFGAKPFVGDSPAWADAQTCAKVLGLDGDLAAMGVPIRQLDQPRRCLIGSGRTTAGLSSVALDADAVINLPKFKAHQQLVATFAVKNMFGCICGKSKALWHFRRGNKPERFCRLLIDIYRTIAPVLTIIDGIVAMEGGGPIHGKSKPLGWLIGGTDPIACELACCALIGLDPGALPMVQAARQVGFGCSDLQQIQFLGDGLPAKPCTDFELAAPAPLKFSFTRVCRSAMRQLMLLARGKRVL